MPDSCRIDLLRHGDTGVSGYRGSLDDPLSVLGWRQMHEALPATIQWHIIVSSPMLRCAEFAKVYADMTGLPLAFDDRLREIHFGAWEGKSAEQLLEGHAAALQKFWNNPWGYTPPNAESLKDFELRVRLAWQDIASRYRSQRILVITHGGVIRMLLYLSGKVTRTTFLDVSITHASLHTMTTRSELVL